MSQRADGSKPRPVVKRRVPSGDFPRMLRHGAGGSSPPALNLRPAVKRRTKGDGVFRMRWHGGLMFGENVTTGAILNEDEGQLLTEQGDGMRTEDVA